MMFEDSMAATPTEMLMKAVSPGTPFSVGLENQVREHGGSTLAKPWAAIANADRWELDIYWA